jgi:hypothetical protein
MKKLSFFALILIVFQQCTAPRSAQLLESGEAPQAEFRDTLPFEMRGGLIVVRARLENTDMPMDFVWNPGLPYSQLTEEAAAYLGMQEAFKLALADGQGEVDELALIDSLELGSSLFRKLAFGFVRYPMYAPERCIAEGGVLGANLLRTCNWVVDFDQRQIVLMDKTQFPDEAPLHRLPFKTDKRSGVPRLKVELPPYGKHTVAVDLGYNGPVAVKVGKVKGRPGGQKVFDAVSRSQLQVFHRLPDAELRVGNWQKAEAKVLACTQSPKAGIQLWRAFRLGFHYGKQELVLWPRELDYKPAAEPILGWLPHFDRNGGVSVGYVREGSPAWEAGLRIGDKIAGIDRRAAPALFNDYCSYFFELRQRFGQRRQMSVKLAGKEAPLRLSAQDSSSTPDVNSQ